MKSLDRIDDRNEFLRAPIGSRASCPAGFTEKATTVGEELVWVTVYNGARTRDLLFPNDGSRPTEPGNRLSPGTADQVCGLLRVVAVNGRKIVVERVN